MQELLMKKSLVLVFDEGLVDGKAVFKRYTYPNAAAGATAQSLHDAAQALASLYAGSLAEIQTAATNSISA